jgi:hypothetical protein
MGERVMVVLQTLALPFVLLGSGLKWVWESCDLASRAVGRALLRAGRTVRAPLDDRFPRATNMVLRLLPLPLAVLAAFVGLAVLSLSAESLSSPEHYRVVDSREVSAEVLSAPATMHPHSSEDEGEPTAVTVVELDGTAVAVPALSAEVGDEVTLWLTRTDPSDLASQSSTRVELGGQEWTLTSQVPRGGHRVSASDVTTMVLAGLVYGALAAAAIGLLALGLGLLRRLRPHRRVGSSTFWVGRGAWKRARKRSEVFASWRAATLLTILGVPLALAPVPLLLAPPLVVQGASYDGYSASNAYGAVSVAAIFGLGPLLMGMLHAARSASELAFERLVWAPDADVDFALRTSAPWTQDWLARRQLDEEVSGVLASGHTGTCGELVELVREFDHA